MSCAPEHRVTNGAPSPLPPPTPTPNLKVAPWSLPCFLAKTAGSLSCIGTRIGNNLISCPVLAWFVLIAGSNQKVAGRTTPADGEKMEKYSNIVQRLVNLGIKLVAVDFDLTILSIHTHGFWPFTSKQLIQKVRPSFQQFLTLALNSGHFHVAVVTQSPQIPLIQEVLREALPTCDTSKIIYRGTDGKWKEVKGISKEGKQNIQFAQLNWPQVLIPD